MFSYFFLAATKNIKYTKKEDSPARLALEEELPYRVPYEGEILIKSNHWNKENLPRSKTEVRKSSTLGKVVCRRWKTKSLLRKLPKVKSFVDEIKPFTFDSLSPDDIVREAQSQSFTRTK